MTSGDPPEDPDSGPHFPDEESEEGSAFPPEESPCHHGVADHGKDCEDCAIEEQLSVQQEEAETEALFPENIEEITKLAESAKTIQAAVDLAAIGTEEDPFAVLSPSLEAAVETLQAIHAGLEKLSAYELARNIAVQRGGHTPSGYDSVERIELVAIAAGLVNFANRGERDDADTADPKPFCTHKRSASAWNFGLHVIDIEPPSGGKSSGMKFLQKLLGDAIPTESLVAVPHPAGFFGGYDASGGKKKAAEVVGPAFRTRKGGVIFLSEFKTLIPLLLPTAGSHGFRGTFLEFFSDGRYRQDVLKGHGKPFLYPTWATVIGGLQVVAWSDLAKAMEDGFFRRFIYTKRADPTPEEAQLEATVWTRSLEEGDAYLVKAVEDPAAFEIFRKKLARIANEFQPTTVDIRKIGAWVEARQLAKDPLFMGNRDVTRVVAALSAGYYVLAKWDGQTEITLPSPDEDAELAGIVQQVFGVRSGLIGDEDRRRLDLDADILWKAGLGVETDGYVIQDWMIKTLAEMAPLSGYFAARHIRGWRDADDGEWHPGLLPKLVDGVPGAGIESHYFEVAALREDLSSLERLEGASVSERDRVLDTLGWDGSRRGPKPRIYRWADWDLRKGSQPPEEAPGGG